MNNKKIIIGLLSISIILLVILSAKAISYTNEKGKEAVNETLSPDESPYGNTPSTCEPTSTQDGSTEEDNKIGEGQEDDKEIQENESNEDIKKNGQKTDDPKQDVSKEDSKREITKKEDVKPESKTKEKPRERKEKAKNTNPSRKPKATSPSDITPAPSSTSSEPPAPQPTPTAKPSTCSLTIRCSNILYNLKDLKKGKEDYIPPNGLVYHNDNAVIEEGESVFDVLRREMRENGILLVHNKSPIFEAYYIEGIANIFEFDCGPKSGWIYRVNGIYQNVACNECFVKDGDKVTFDYTCNSGEDLD